MVSKGPYHYVRNPMSASFVLLVLGTPLLLGARYGILLGLILVVMVASGHGCYTGGAGATHITEGTKRL